MNADRWVIADDLRSLSKSDVSDSVWKDFQAVSDMQSADMFVKKHDLCVSFNPDGGIFLRRKEAYAMTSGQKMWEYVRRKMVVLPARLNPEDEAKLMGISKDHTKDMVCKILDNLAVKYMPERMPKQLRTPKPETEKKQLHDILKGMTAAERRAHFGGGV